MSPARRSLLDLWVENRRTRVEDPKEHLTARLRKLSLRADRGLVTSIARQNEKRSRLLPPAGGDVFRRLSPESLAELHRQTVQKKAEKKKAEKKEVEKKKVKVSKAGRPKPSRELEAGQILPFVFGEPPPELLGVPLEELDPFHQAQKTFIVINKGSRIFRFNAESACCLLSPLNIVRRAAIRVVVHSFFHWFLMLTILTHFVFLAITPTIWDVGPAWIRFAELMFTGIYTLEALIKVLSRGFCVGHFTYLRNPWNWLDLLLIAWVFINEFVYLGNLSALRMFRVLRALDGHCLKTFRGALVRSVKKLADVMLFVIFILSVSALLYMQFFMGVLRQKCTAWPMNFTEPEVSTSFDDDHHPQTAIGADYYESYYVPGNLDALLCGNSSDSGTCPEGYQCIKHGRNPNYGFTSYDNFGAAFLSMFRLMTLDFWENLFQLTIRAAGKSSMAIFVVTIIGFFYLVSLILAVIAMAFATQNEADLAEAREDEEEYQRILTELKRQVKTDSGDGASHQKFTDLENTRGPCRRGWDKFADMFLKWDCCGPCVVFRKWLYIVMMDPFMDLFFRICVIVNTVFMAMEHFPMSPHFEVMLSTGELVFFFIFAAEVVLKIIAMDPYHYFQVGWNIFDSGTVMLKSLDLIMNLSILRLLRIFRLGKTWPAFNMLIRTLRLSVGALAKLSLTLAGTVLTFAVVGVQLFGKSYKDCVCKIASDCELPRWHMTEVFSSFLIVFRVLCGEWIEVMWDMMEVAGIFWSIVFIMSVVVIGNLVVLHVFMGLLFSSFRGDLLALSQEDRYVVNQQIALRRICRGISWVTEFINVGLLGRTPADGEDRGGPKNDNLALEHMDPQKDPKAAPVDSSLTVPIAKAEVDFENLDDESENDAIKKKEGEKSSHCSQADPKPVEVTITTEKEGPQDCFSEGCIQCFPCLTADITQGRGKMWWNLRRTCFTIVKHHCFRHFITFIILLSCVPLAMEDIYMGQRKVLQIILAYAELVFVCVFFIEMVLKWVAYGFKTYFTNAWCWLEFLIINVSVLYLTATAMGISGVGLLRLLRALRLPSLFAGTRLVLSTLFGAIPALFNVLLACMTFWLIFCIMGVKLFAGKFSYCFNATSEQYFLTHDVDNRTECLELMQFDTAVRWLNVKVQFDDVSSGFLALLQVGTRKGWMDLMYAATDARYVEMQPEYDANPSSYLFFVFFLIGSFFTLTLFLGDFIDYYLQQKAKAGGKDLYMTEGQRRCWRYELMRKRQKPIPRPQNRVQGLVFDLVTKPLFEFLVMALLCVYMVLLMTESDDQTLEMDEIQFWGNFVYILILVIECALKIFALRKYYFTQGWNIFDFVVVIISVVGMFLADVLEKYFVSPTLFRVLRAARIVCVLRLLKRAKGINELLTALMMSLPAIFNLVLLLLIIMFIYSVIGMSIFPFLENMAGISDMMNFETFGNSMMCMFEITTLAGWDGLLLPTLNDEMCDPRVEHPGVIPKGGCGGSFSGIVFFCSYIVICIFIGINMYIAIILENFNVATEESADPLCEDDFEMFYETWEKFDPDATQYVAYNQLSDFCDTLKDPLRIPKPNTVKLITMNLPMAPGDKIHRRDILMALTAEVRGVSEETDSLMASMEERFLAKNPSKLAYEPVTTTLRRKQEEVAAGVIQRAYRKRLPKTDQPGEVKEPAEGERAAAKPPAPSLDGSPAAAEDPETQPLMDAAEDSKPATDPNDHVMTKVILHSAPQPTATANNSADSVA